MAVRRDARFNHSVNKPARRSHKCLPFPSTQGNSERNKVTVKRLTKKVEKLRDKLNLMKEFHEQEKAMVEEKEREFAEGRKWNDLAFREDACVRLGINITLGIIDAQDEGDHVRANGLMGSFRELVSDHIEERAALLSAGQV